MPRNRRQSIAGQGRRGSKSVRKKSRARRRSSSSKNPSVKTPPIPEFESPSQSSPEISGSPSQTLSFSLSQTSGPGPRPSRRLSKSPTRRASLKARRKSTTDDDGVLTKKKRKKTLQRQVTSQSQPLKFNSQVSFALSVEQRPVEYLEGSDLDVSRRPRILQIPTKALVEILNLLNNSTLLILRTVCHRLKFDVDNFVGVHAVINQNHRSFGFFIRVGIRSAIITNLFEQPYGKIREVLVYPDLLLELSIQGNVSDAYFAYLMENCRNLVHLEINFSKRLLLNSPCFFPTTDCENHLAQLRKLEITSETRFESELKCVRENLEGLFTCNLKDFNISNFHIHLVHNIPSPTLRKCHEVVADFVNSNAHDLVTLAITIKEKRGDRSTRSVSDFDAIVNQFIAHPPVTANSMTDLGDLLTAELKDQDNSDDTVDLEPLSPFIWKTFKQTKELHLSINGINAQAWKDMPLEMKVLHSLYLDIVTNEGNWYMYRTTVHNCANTLRKVYLIDVAREAALYHNEYDHNHANVNNIDLGFFNICRNLRLLTLKCQETGAGAIYRMKSVSEIPKTVTAIHFAWAILNPLQMIRLLVFRRHLNCFQVEYWSSSLSNFRRFLCLLKYVFKFGLTKAPLITIVDHKVRFQSGLSSVKSIIKSIAPAAHYIDKEQTLLEIDTSILHTTHGY